MKLIIMLQKDAIPHNEDDGRKGLMHLPMVKHPA
jgi:hypothetical protein